MSRLRDTTAPTKLVRVAHEDIALLLYARDLLGEAVSGGCFRDDPEIAVQARRAIHELANRLDAQFHAKGRR